MRKRARRGAHSRSWTAGATDPNTIRNAQGQRGDRDLGPELRLDPSGRVRVRQDPTASQMKLGKGLQRQRDGSIALRPMDSVDDLDSAAVLADVIATVNSILQTARAAGYRKG